MSTPKDNIYQGLFKKSVLGDLTPVSPEAYKEFLKGLGDNQSVEVFMEATVNDGTSLQIAKIHVCIRKLAKELGYTFDEMKKVIKERTGLVVNEDYKSFADCSKEDFSLVIQTIIEIGDQVNINFR